MKLPQKSAGFTALFCFCGDGANGNIRTAKVVAFLEKG